ncbi:hypothetical protein BG846_01088 [Streptomyces fradiae ATCC 10745 = DSM 40063]|uniref:Uncharacterized protein n=1 Tax=Streptomyces fradiae ATCC 10745 = DSM 40063 TaxID=1319510 RepID=A0A1Y2P1C3_STRFR|nr:hypothetical protein BG846_01088 [Streptomyces fradiae ATCC 10745 = DSM 40063]
MHGAGPATRLAVRGAGSRSPPGRARRRTRASLTVRGGAGQHAVHGAGRAWHLGACGGLAGGGTCRAGAGPVGARASQRGRVRARTACRAERHVGGRSGHTGRAAPAARRSGGAPAEGGPKGSRPRPPRPPRAWAAGGARGPSRHRGSPALPPGASWSTGRRRTYTGAADHGYVLNAGRPPAVRWEPRAVATQRSPHPGLSPPRRLPRSRRLSGPPRRLPRSRRLSGPPRRLPRSRSLPVRRVPGPSLSPGPSAARSRYRGVGP